MTAIWEDLTFWKVRWITISHGVMDDMKVAFCGYESQAKLTSVQQETFRGLLACIADGRLCGSLAYGYRLDKTRKVVKRGKKETLRGVLEKHPERELVVSRIYRLYDAGNSEDAIAKLLNVEGVTSPSGGRWLASTIRGEAKRGVGVLRNPIYIGKLIGGRFSWRRHPKTGKRKSTPTGAASAAPGDKVGRTWSVIGDPPTEAGNSNPQKIVARVTSMNAGFQNSFPVRL